MTAPKPVSVDQIVALIDAFCERPDKALGEKLLAALPRWWHAERDDKKRKPKARVRRQP